MRIFVSYFRELVKVSNEIAHATSDRRSCFPVFLVCPFEYSFLLAPRFFFFLLNLGQFDRRHGCSARATIAMTELAPCNEFFYYETRNIIPFTNFNIADTSFGYLERDRVAEKM